MSTHSQPVAAEARLFSLDLIRGVALYGIFIMNMPGFSHSSYAEANGVQLAHAWLDQLFDTFRELLFAGKFNSLFCLLFGYGFALQLARLQRDAPTRATVTYLRRLGALLLIGVLHGALLWPGDVLHLYALLGFLLLLLHRRSDRVLIGIFIACALFPLAYGLMRFHWINPEVSAYLAQESARWVANDNLAYGQGGFWDAVAESISMFGYNHTSIYNLRGLGNYSVQLFASMLLGYLAGRHGYLQAGADRLSQLKRLQWLSLVTGLGCTVLVALTLPYAGTIASSPAKLLFSLGQAWGRLALALFYALTLARLALLPNWHQRLAPLATMGRMPLSNYLLQTLLGIFIFYHWGLGYWNQAGPMAEVLLATALFLGVQMPLSTWWLKRHRYGPLEYAWRVLTYGRRSTGSSALPAPTQPGLSG
ncbi:DUF418 domain-containing protein [Chitinimonas sp.]|uniref:DUF418 domain-containing protein n=1 Tax=Chitinimonas sp. TaxID=1934313 RepID=UPI002F937F83